MQHFTLKLVQAGLSSTEASLYAFIHLNPGVSVAEACLKLKQSKSSVYRAFDGLREKNLIDYSTQEWRQSLKVHSLNALVEKIEERRSMDASLIEYFKSFET